MAKRFQPFKEFGRSTKKPKLDVSINKGRPLGPSQSWPNHIRSNAGEVHVKSPARNNVNNNNLWDDDDDDVILLATQVAESQVAIKTSDTNITDSDITFSEFAPHIHATTSTQRLTTVNAGLKATVSAPPTIENNNFSELFADDDDFAELLDVAGNGKKEQEITRGQHFETDNVFKKPIAIVNGRNGMTITTPQASQVNTAQTSDGQQAAARRQVATERQVKMLMERMDALKAENAKLTKDLSESKAKIESKDGESSLLRDELRHMKQQLQTLKMEKLMSTEAAKTECKTKIAELTKRVEAKESELKLRKVEYSVLKMRHADETQRLEMSIRNAVAGDVPMEEDVEQMSNKQNARILYRLRDFSLSTGLGDTNNSHLTEFSANAFERTQERVTGKRQYTPFQLELDNAQTLLAQLQLQRHKGSWTSTEAADFNERAIASACNALPEFWTYVHGLEFPKYCNVHPYHEYDLRNDDYTSPKRNLHAEQQLCEDERAISLRRYISALSVMCGRAPNFAQQLLAQHHGDYALLQVACHAISKLGYSREICAHFGVLEAFAVLLRVLLRQVRTGDSEHVELLVGGLLKQLIFVRPSAWIFCELSHCVLELTRIPAALERICVNSDESTFYSDRMRSLYRFSNDSCILQVYAGLLEIAFPLNDILSVSHMQLLTVICENHVRFAHYCFMKPPDFIHKLLPSYDDDDDEEDDEAEQQVAEKKVHSCKSISSEISVNNSEMGATANSTSNMASRSKKSTNSNTATRCECYTKLCLSVVTLLFQLLRQWRCTGRKIETPRVAEISQLSVQLLHTIFCDNYSTHLFRYAEETTKHYLWLISEWWSENAERLKFNSAQNNFLKKLRAFHIMPKQLNEEGNPVNVLNDLNEWHSLTNDSRSRNPDTSVNITLAVEKMNIMHYAGDEAKFFEGLKGYAFNFE
ncbi:ATR-interacting protein mus304 [Bactrocera dorsalis]|uniref:ATR-interacting protein mus304 n=1 Tax=Bactrocera dorsalis TaxID=27457 RepID=A0A6I9UTK0_BACDO|nr:ATR-interacting protein mus304 [Bactrocera dorsalis]